MSEFRSEISDVCYEEKLASLHGMYHCNRRGTALT